MAEPGLNELYGWNDRVASFVHHSLVLGMLLCLVSALISFGESLLPGWQGDYLLVVAVLVTVDAMIAARHLRGYDIFSRDWITYRFAEWIVILVGLKVILYLVHGVENLFQDLPLWRDAFLDSFFTSEYLFSIGLTLFIWLLAGAFTAELHKLEGDERLLQIERESRITEQRPEARRNLANMIWLVGAGMIFIAALMRLDWQALWGDEPPPLHGGILPIVIYFVLSLALLSLTQFAILRVHWSLERIPIHRDLAIRWLGYSAVTLISLAILASLLPTRYSVGLLQVLGDFLYLVSSLLSLILILVITPFFWLLSVLAQLFGQPVQLDPPTLEPPQLLPPPEEAAPISWLEYLKSVLFWSVFLLVIGFSIYHYLSQNQALLAWLRRLPVLGPSLAAFRRFLSFLRRTRQGVASSFQASIARLRRTPGRIGNPIQFTHLGRLTPRERIIFFYLTMVRRGTEGGLPRRGSQTASEYSQQLRLQVPDVSPEVDDLTAQFLEARYSQHPVSGEASSLAQRLWQRIRKALRGKSSGRSTSNE